MFPNDSIDAQLLRSLERQIEHADEEILGGDLMGGMLDKKAVLRNIVSLCEKNNDEEQLAVFRDKYAAEFPKEFADPKTLSKFKHLNKEE